MSMPPAKALQLMVAARRSGNKGHPPAQAGATALTSSSSASLLDPFSALAERRSSGKRSGAMSADTSDDCAN